ncbi:MAG: protein translocase SEC61 complex subunit gamma [Candidatus Micrarchaeota archaeon]
MELKDLIKRCIRILYISRKPTNAEYSKVAKITALGMFLFGLVGFIVSFLFRLIK